MSPLADLPFDFSPAQPEPPDIGDLIIEVTLDPDTQQTTHRILNAPDLIRISPTVLGGLTGPTHSLQDEGPRPIAWLAGDPMRILIVFHGTNRTLIYQLTGWDPDTNALTATRIPDQDPTDGT